MNKKLTTKQYLFVKEYIIDGNATRAAKAAGYSEKTAYSIGNENLSKPEIIEALEGERQKRLTRLQIDQDWVLREAVEVYHRCMQKTPVRDSEGNETGEYKFSDSGANKALDMIAKLNGVDAYAKQKLEIDVTHNDIAEKLAEGRKRAEQSKRITH